MNYQMPFNRNINPKSPSVALVLLCLSLLQILVPESVFSEPWLSNRYAQNCSGCHAPGRKNLPFSHRRCTLSCQACHVNPNGGGMRNFYGKWTTQRPDPPFKPRGRLVYIPLTSALHDKEYPVARRRRGEPLYQEHFNMSLIIEPIIDRHPN